ncbi:response regulator [Dictyobacter halimunensis]|uniref:response regulator n=1 Tax=Dictyobacter halimunensis TaxID=3026934 RepID=UPI0030C73025
MTPYQVLHVQDGFASLKTVRSVIPHLIFLDYQLPGMDGLECLDVFRATKGMEQVPIIFMSANLSDQARRHKDVFLLEKPFELESVIHLVKQALGDERGP